MDEASPPSAGVEAQVSLREVTAQTVRDICNLSVAPAPAIVGDDAEAILEGRRQGRARSTIVERAENQDDRRPLSYPIERDGGTVFGAYLVHVP
jgi:hypothetical protein